MRTLRVLYYFLFLFLVTSCSSGKVSPGYHRTAVVKKSIRKAMVPTIVVDAGHGGFNLGARYNGIEEKEVCLKTAHILRNKLEQLGYHVIMTRSRDEYIPLKKRAEIANRAKCQALVSLHFNAAKNTSAHGIEVFYATKAEPWRKTKSKELAQKVLSKMISHTDAKSRGIKEGNFCVIRETHMPSILVEGGFLTNVNEHKQIGDDRYIQRLAEAIAEGIHVYFQA